jgi:hypothetical protein
MAMPTIKIARCPGIPAGFSLIREVIDGEVCHFLRRDMDDRRARVEWEEGEKHYTYQWLSTQMAKDADYENPLLKANL